MKSTILLYTCIAIVVVAAGGFFILKNQKAKIASTQKEMVSESSQETEKTPPKDSDTAAMVTKIAQITLTVSSPANNSTVRTAKVTVKGKTLAKAEVFANEAEGVADAAGNFSLPVNLDDGDNEIIITAVDSDGNVAETVVTVTYNAEG